MVTSGIVGALFNGEPRAPPPTRSQPKPCSHTYPIYVDWVDPDKYDNMRPHDGRLKEIGIFDEDSEDPHAQYPSRTSNEEFVIKKETPEKKRKYDEIYRMQTLHRQPVVDSARAVDMEEIHFNEPFTGFNYAANPNNTRWGPYHHDAFNPPNHIANSGRAFYDESSIYSNSMPESPNVAQSLSGDTLVPESFVPGSFGATELTHTAGADSFVHGSFGAAEPHYTSGNDPFAFASFDDAESSHIDGAETYVPGSYGSADPACPGVSHAFAPAPSSVGPDSMDVADDLHEGFKEEDTQGNYSVSATPADESEFAESDSEYERPRKASKLNKDGEPRKPRQPRPKLLKWSDDDWKNVCLGIVWACGETGVQIPFDQAAQVVGEKCTAGALQQALLKLRGKQIDAGHSIPSLKMAWTRKNKFATPGAKTKGSIEPEANKPRKKPTRFEATQSFIVTLPRAYNDRDRKGLQAPYRWKKPSRRVKSANVKNEQFPYVSDYLATTPENGRQFYQSPPITPFGNNVGYLQGMVIGGGEYANLLTTEGLHEVGNVWGDATDDVFGA